jgi:ABC-type bacteriocin/lantibiotic exporter with double-glycine peptidase domain
MNTASIKTKPKAKVQKNYIGYVHILFKNRTNYQPMKYENEKQLKSIEKYLMKHIHSWKWATLREIGTNAILAYYHPSTGVEHLDLETYKKQFTAYSLYIIPTSAYKRKTGIMKGKSQRIYDLDQIHQYWTKDVLRIDVYVEGKQINSYENGRFLK